MPSIQNVLRFRSISCVILQLLLLEVICCAKGWRGNNGQKRETPYCIYYSKAMYVDALSPSTVSFRSSAFHALYHSIEQHDLWTCYPSPPLCWWQPAVCFLSIRGLCCDTEWFSDIYLSRLQRVQHQLTRLVTKSPPFTRTVPLLRSLPWLPVRFRILLKINLLTYKTLREKQPGFLHSMLPASLPSRSLRSNNDNSLSVPREESNTGGRAFQSCTPSLWNNLPLSVRSATNSAIWLMRISHVQVCAEVSGIFANNCSQTDKQWLDIRVKVQIPPFTYCKDSRLVSTNQPNAMALLVSLAMCELHCTAPWAITNVNRLGAHLR